MRYFGECEITKNWYKNLEKDEEERLNRVWNDDLDSFNV